MVGGGRRRRERVEAVGCVVDRDRGEVWVRALDDSGGGRIRWAH
jgi:hypothetical protein